MIKMVVFDMAGTVIDEKNIVYKSMQQAICKAGYQVSLDTVLRDGSGKEKLQAIKDVMATYEPLLDDQYLAIHEDFNSILNDNYRNLDIEAMPDSQKVFNELKKNGIKVALNTGYHRDMALYLINRIGWKKSQAFDVLVTASDVRESRPHPAMILRAMELMQIDDAASVAKIGDSAIDIDEGKNAGCGLTFGVTTGAQSRTQLRSADPDYVVDSLSEMLTIVTQEHHTH